MKNIYILLITLLSFNLAAQEVTLEDISKQVMGMEKKYSIKFNIDSMPKTTWAIKYEFAQKQDYGNLYDYLKLFDKALGKYPLSFLDKVKLKKVIFVKNLKLNESNQEQATPAIPDNSKSILILDFIIGNYDKTYQEHTVHHTFYKFLDKQFNAKLNWNDPVWNSFNSSNDAYKSQDVYSSEINHSHKGFVNSYSLYDVIQDKAEIFATLFTKIEYKKLQKWVKKDSILFNKAMYLQDFLKGIDRSFDDMYWRKLND